MEHTIISFYRANIVGLFKYSFLYHIKNISSIWVFENIDLNIWGLGKTHIKKSSFLSGRTTKSVGRINPPDH